MLIFKRIVSSDKFKFKLPFLLFLVQYNILTCLGRMTTPIDVQRALTQESNCYHCYQSQINN